MSTRIVNDFYGNELKQYLDENGGKASLFLKRFVVLTRNFVATNPRYQRRMDDYAKVSS